MADCTSDKSQIRQKVYNEPMGKYELFVTCHKMRVELSKVEKKVNSVDFQT